MTNRGRLLCYVILVVGVALMGCGLPIDLVWQPPTPSPTPSPRPEPTPTPLPTPDPNPTPTPTGTPYPEPWWFQRTTLDCTLPTMIEEKMEDGASVCWRQEGERSRCWYVMPGESAPDGYQVCYQVTPRSKAMARCHRLPVDEREQCFEEVSSL
jgi:hypothetical protein